MPEDAPMLRTICEKLKPLSGPLTSEVIRVSGEIFVVALVFRSKGRERLELTLIKDEDWFQKQ